MHFFGGELVNWWVLYTKTTKVRLKSFNQSSLALDFPPLLKPFPQPWRNASFRNIWRLNFWISHTSTMRRWAGEKIKTTVAGGCLKVCVWFFLCPLYPPKKLEMVFSIFGASIWWSCKTENSFQNWKNFSPEVFSKWRNGLHPRSLGDLTTFWSNYIRFQVVTIGIQLT